MGSEAHIQAGGGNRLLRMLGLGQAPEAHAEEHHPHHTIQAERAAMLAAISDFLMRHDLPVSAENLARAHAILSGADRRLAAKVAARENSGQPVSQEWLDDNDGVLRRNQEPSEELDRIARSLETSVMSFGETTQTAQAAASFYGAELERQVAAVEAVHNTDNIVASLAHVARTMLERTREMEDQMRRSENEAKSLRKNLEKARRDATIDHLTNLPNRRAFEEVFREQWIAAQAEMEPLCLAICDIDFFKRVNDVHGHDTGDRIICAVGQALDRISDNCHVARHGGEEFVLLFRGLDIDAATGLLDGARERFAARRFVDKISGRPIGEVTFSGGMTNVFAHSDLSSALRAADEALYKAKQEGRNRIERG